MEPNKGNGDKKMLLVLYFKRSEKSIYFTMIFIFYLFLEATFQVGVLE